MNYAQIHNIASYVCRSKETNDTFYGLYHDILNIKWNLKELIKTHYYGGFDSYDDYVKYGDLFMTVKPKKPTAIVRWGDYPITDMVTGALDIYADEQEHKKRLTMNK
jgi:hypothetical protein